MPKDMQRYAPSTPSGARPLWLIVVSAGIIVATGMGLRQVMGLYLPPVTSDLGIGRQPFSAAVAVANLVWGLGAVLAGVIADRWLSMLYGVVFLSHQIGSFTGLWMAGYLYDRMHSYDAMWWILVALGLFAAAVHWPIREGPVARLGQIAG
jgi:hypothetical protein